MSETKPHHRTLHNLMTRLVTKPVRRQPEGKIDSIYQIEIRLGFNWATYPIENQDPLMIWLEDDEVEVRIVQVTDNVATKVTIGSITYDLGAPRAK